MASQDQRVREAPAVIRWRRRRLWLLAKSRNGQCTKSKRPSRQQNQRASEQNRKLLGQGIHPSQIQGRVGTRTVTLMFPETLSVRDAPDAIAEFFNRLNDAFFHIKAGTVLIDHSALQSATPDGVLVLIAELQRVTKYSPRTALRANFRGTCAEVMAIFEKVGYLQKFDVHWNACEGERRVFLKSVRGIGAVASASGMLVKEFIAAGFLSSREGQALGGCLVECMDNTCDHAYRTNILLKASVVRRLRKNWWLLGFIDPENSEICFVFYDQGAGMPNTLRFKKRDKVELPVIRELISRDDEELVMAAFKRPFTRTMEQNRGRGLPSLRRMVEHSAEGELFVQSLHSRVFMRPKTKISSERAQNPLAGTLLVWKIRRGTFLQNDHDATRTLYSASGS
jgi:hypothetical protein